MATLPLLAVFARAAAVIWSLWPPRQRWWPFLPVLFILADIIGGRPRSHRRSRQTCS